MQTAGGWNEFVSLISAGSMIIYRFLCGFVWISLCQSIKIKPTKCITTATGCSSKLTHTGVEIDACAFQVGCQLSSAASDMSLGLCFLHNFSGMKQTCWTAGSWWCCLSLEVVSSIPTGSTIINRFLCGFICVSLCQNIKIKPTKCYLVLTAHIVMKMGLVGSRQLPHIVASCTGL